VRITPRIMSVPFLGILLLAPMAHAQFGAMGMPGRKLVTFGLGGGVAVPVSDAKDAFKNGFNGLAYARIAPPGLPVSFGLNVAFSRFDLADAKVTTGGSTTTAVTGGNSQLLAGLGDVKLDLMRSRIHPYLIAGLGAYNVKTNPAGSSSSSNSDTRFGINGGGGISMSFGRVSGYIQGRVDNVYTSDNGAIKAKDIQIVPVTAGIEF
jgi:hypothetical protein